MSYTAVPLPDAPVPLVRYDWGGPSDGPAVLLAHPTGFNGLAWTPVAERLVARGCRVWSFDFRGHGTSDRAPNGYEWTGFRDDVAAVIDSIGVTPVLGVGISKGGAALLLEAARAPQRFTTLWCYEPIVFSPGFAPPGTRNPMAEMARKRRAQWPSPEAAFESYSARPPMRDLHPDALRGYLAAGLRATTDEWELTCAPEDEAQMYEMGIDNGVYELLPTITTPVTVLAGEHTDTITPAWARQLADRLPLGHLEVWDGRGHFGPLEDPERGAAELAAAAGVD